MYTYPRWKTYNCLDDPSQIEFAGSLFSKNLRQLSLALVPKRCENNTNCKGPEELKNFIDRHRIVILLNQRTYAPMKYDIDKAILYDYLVHTTELDSNYPNNTQTIEIQKATLNSEEVYSGLSMSEESRTFYTMEISD